MIYLITTIVFTSVLLLALALLYHLLVSKSDLSTRLETLFPDKREKKRPESGLWADKLRLLGENVKLTPHEQTKYSKTLIAAWEARSSSRGSSRWPTSFSSPRGGRTPSWSRPC